jgi:hypothetical protein
MNKKLALTASGLMLGFLGLIFLPACGPLPMGAPYPSHGGYDHPYYGSDDYSRHRERERMHEEHERLERERERLEQERRRVEHEEQELHRQQEHNRQQQAQHAPQQQPLQTHCPPGYVQSEQKCTDKERKHGCKDVRLNSGIGCVHRP